jgi:hypothetical protein
MSIYPSTKVLPYVYWLNHKITGQFYIGYREANKLPADQDLPIYQTSSKKIKELGFENFDWKIVAEFFDGDSAYNFENHLIESYIKDPLCINGHYRKNGSNHFKRTGPHSAETKIKISLAAKFISQETRDKLATAGRNQSPEKRAKLSIAQTGRIYSEQSKQKMSAAKLNKKRNPLSEETKAKISLARKNYWEKKHAEYLANFAS